MRKFLILLLLAVFACASPAAAARHSAKTDASRAAARAEAPKAEAGKVDGAEATPTEFVMTIGDPEDSEMGLLGIAFKNYIRQASDGRMDVRLSYSGGLDADETYQFHRVQVGKLAMAMGGVGNLAPMIPMLGVVTLPYLFPDVEAVVRGTTGKAAELLESYAEKAGVRILAWTYYGYRFLSNSKKPVKTLADMKGLRIRVPQSLVMIKTYRAFGAIPMPLAWPATRSALKNDLVDGQCYDYNGFRTMKFRDVGQKYITEIHYLYNLQPLVINLKLFNSLSEKDRQILVDAGKHIQDLSLQYQREMNSMAKKTLVEEGVHISTLDDETPWREIAVSKVWDSAADNVGGVEAINNYLRACDLPEWQPAPPKTKSARGAADAARDDGAQKDAAPESKSETKS
ncbi:MAG: TRAP transporter substrate-binding protein [Desulfovibrio sp.]|nr:TRAP transporter substrate-binding protein [Desulfovibrio sp.]